VVRISSDSEESRPARECPAQFDLRSYCENKAEARDDASELSGWRNKHLVLQVNWGSFVVAMWMVLRGIADFATHANLCLGCTAALLLVASQCTNASIRRVVPAFKLSDDSMIYGAKIRT